MTQPAAATRLGRLFERVLPADGGQPVLGIVGPGGSGKSDLLDAMIAAIAGGGGAVLRGAGRRLETGASLAALDAVVEPGAVDERRARDDLLARMAAGATLVVDDAQWLDPASLRVLVGVAERAGERPVGLVVAHRPVSGLPDLALLDAALARRAPLVVLGPLTEAEVAQQVARALGSAADAGLVDALAVRTEGVPLLVDRMLAGWVESGMVAAGHVTQADPPLPPQVIELVRMQVDQLAPAERLVLVACSLSSTLEDDLLSSVTGLDLGELGDALEGLRAAGLLFPHKDDVLPAVAEAVNALIPAGERRRFHGRLAAALSERGSSPARAAEHLDAAGATGPEAAAAYLAAGDEALYEFVELARSWYDRAVAAGADVAMVAARRAEAAALAGDLSTALRLADGVVDGPDVPDRTRGLEVLAAVLPSRGLWARSADLYATLGSSADGYALHDFLAVPGLVATGQLDQARKHLALGDGRRARPAAFRVEAAALMAEAAVESVTGTAAGALALFVEAAELLESGSTAALLPDTPHALGAVVACVAGEFGAAEHLLGRALEHEAGGAGASLRHRLLLGWVGLRSGRWAMAQSALDESAGRSISARDGLLAAALDAGLARRAGDLPRLTAAWQRAEPLLHRHPAVLFSVEAIGELAVAAGRLEMWERIARKAKELGDVVRALGEPPLWVLPLRWYGLQAAVAIGDLDAVSRRAAEVEAVPAPTTRLATLAPAARMWVSVLRGEFDPGDVQAAAAGLQSAGLSWEASRLTGQAAIRSDDAAVTRSLLEQARDLKTALPTTDTGAVPASSLSEREQEVASHIVDGLTYKEIGALLFISPKTVEHHVAKVRQKLGATTRAEMLAALRDYLDR